MESRIDWLKGRQKGIGGSDVSGVLGLNKYKTPLDIYRSKTEEVVEDAQSEAAYFGTALEDFVAKEFSKRTGMKVQRVNKQLVHPDAEWRVANIDRAIVNPDIASRVMVKPDAKREPGEPLITTDAILECKTASQFLADQWGASQEDEIVRGVESEENDHKIPLAYECQIQWYMGVTGVQVAYVAVLIGSADFRIFKVKRDDELISIIFEKCDAFWKEHVLKRVAPEPVNMEDVKALYERDSGELVEADNDAAILLGELRNVASEIKTLRDKESALKEELVMKIGEASGLMLGGETVVTYKSQTSNRFNVTAFKKEHPDLYKEFTKTTNTRVFRLK